MFYGYGQKIIIVCLYDVFATIKYSWDTDKLKIFVAVLNSIIKSDIGRWYTLIPIYQRNNKMLKI